MYCKTHNIEITTAMRMLSKTPACVCCSLNLGDFVPSGSCDCKYDGGEAPLQQHVVAAFEGQRMATGHTAVIFNFETDMPTKEIIAVARKLGEFQNILLQEVERRNGVDSELNFGKAKMN